ncbi:polysaccharide biosynthesis protein [Bacteriovorax sp. BAL6_X]|uniref:oligosaccharide flippase family protein n=1 Tax=Bacteriovorax sp. BAL6_X TaxID=1201290 RepID=UPI0003869038|nr:oligosaccharide flippase family protein [Bacteriovorax sp. BAL6_X]EPZ50408.1 polysaccharide biosynthesis protein [Bacteriovorax sp. BAL6_X]
MNSLNTKIYSNIIWQFFPSVLRIGISFVGTMYVANQMTKTDFGTFQYLTSYFYIFLMFEHLTHSNILKEYFLESGTDDTSRLFSSIFISMIFCFLALMISMFWFRESQEWYLWSFFMIALFFRSFSPISYYFDSLLLSKYGSTSQLIGSLSFNLIRLLNPISLTFQCAVFSLQFVIVSIINIFTFKAKINNFKHIKLPSFSIVKNIFVKSFPLFISVLLVQLTQRVDVFILKSYLSFEDVADYSVAVKFAEPWMFLASSVVVSVFPKLISINKNDMQLVNISYNFVNKVLMIMGALIATVTLLLSAPVLEFVFDQKYNESIKLLNLYILSTPFLFLNLVQQIWEQKNEYLYFSVLRLCIGLFSNILLNIFLIPKYGTEGAVYATLISYSFFSVFSNLLTKKSRKYLLIQLSFLRLDKYKIFFK